MQGVQPPPSRIIQPSQFGGMVQSQHIGVMPSTNAVTALVLSIIGVIGAFFYGLGIVFSIPGLVIANKARAITTQIPGHPDSGMATAAVVISWIGVIIGGLYILAVLGLILFFIFAFESGF